MTVADHLLWDEGFQRARDEGKTVRQVAEELGVSAGLVSKVAPVHERNPSEREHPEADPRPSRADAIKADLAEMESPAGQRWSKALAALRLVNEQASVEAMFADRYTRVDHAIGPELTRAREWINDGAKCKSAYQNVTAAATYPKPMQARCGGSMRCRQRCPVLRRGPSPP